MISSKSAGCRFLSLVLSLAVFASIGFAEGENPSASKDHTFPVDRIIQSTQSWGLLGIDVAAHSPGTEAMRLRVKETEYAHGLGHHADGEILIDLAGDFAWFETEIGVQKQPHNQGSVVFEVLVDGEKVFESQPLREMDPAQSIRIPVEGAMDLVLAARDASDGISCDLANWLNPVLIPSSRTHTHADQRAQFDAAPFARVVSWDPNRMDGARSSRVEEMVEEDIFLESPAMKVEGTWLAAPHKGDLAAIGLQWAERRWIREAGLRFEDAASAPHAMSVQMQVWEGESHWQGKWKPVKAEVRSEEGWLVFSWSHRDHPQLSRDGTEKVRWVFPVPEGGLRVGGFTAPTRSVWESARIRLEADDRWTSSRCEIEVYNGEMLSPDSDESLRSIDWEMSKPLELTVRYTRPRPWKRDRTNLSILLPEGGSAVSVESVIENETVYLRDRGVLVSLASSDHSIDSIKTEVDQKKTLIETVRSSPDQTFEQAMDRVHNPIQNLGPMMLSLACDNRKFVAHRNGLIEFRAVEDHPGTIWGGGWRSDYRITPHFSAADPASFSRRLDGDWTPVPVIEGDAGGAKVSQRTFVAPVGEPNAELPWTHEKKICVADWSLSNPTESDIEIAFDLTFDGNQGETTIESVQGGILIRMGGSQLARWKSQLPDRMTVEADGGKVIRVRGTLNPGARASFSCLIPGWEASTEVLFDLPPAQELAEETKAYWDRILEPATRISIPDPLLEDVIRASQVHCLLAARHDPEDHSIAAWIASDRYGPLESEAHSIILGMGRLGHIEFAQRSLDYFIKQYNEKGFLTTGYTLMGTGWHLWTLAEHFKLSRDEAWLKAAASEVSRVCRWIDDQTERTRRLDSDGEKFPEYGLMPPGVVADWNRFLYRFVFQAHYHAGLRDAAAVLGEVGHPSASDLLAAADEFREEIRRAYKWSVERTPAFQLSTGEWSSADPSALYCFGPLGEVFPGEDGNRSWCYDVELGAHHLIPTGVVDPISPEADAMIEHLEDFQFLQSGMGDYPREKNEADPFNLGGFAKVQPYYCRIADVYALRDEVKPFIRTYFNAIPTLLSLEILSFWEHFHNIAAWNKTHETGWFLSQTRTLLLMERGKELWLAPFVTNNWLKDGMEVAVENAPTHFGMVSYRIASRTAKGEIEAVIDPPQRNPPASIVLRIRHPEGAAMKSVTVNGTPIEDFDTEREIVTISPSKGPIRVVVSY